MASAGPARTAVIVSGRPLVAGALRALLADECGHDHCHAVHDERGLLALPPAPSVCSLLMKRLHASIQKTGP